MFENVRRDVFRACLKNQGGYSRGAVVRELFNPGTQAILLYRLGYWLDRVRPRPLRLVLRGLHFLAQYLVSWRVGIFIHPKAEIGPGMVIHTWGGGVFVGRTRVGRDLTVVGGGVLMDFETREIGDEVVIGAGTKIINKVRIGHRVHTGPNTVVQCDVPDDCLVYGNPGRIFGPFRNRPSRALKPSGGK
jgi:serine O-acetyltransferase